MDPNQAYEDWLLALTDKDKEAAVDAAEALAGWLKRGGFEPRGWTQQHRAEFIAWCDEHDVTGV